METAGFQNIRPALVSCALRRFVMGDAVNLDNQFSIQRYEVHDVPVDGVLATEFPPRQTSIAQRLPKFGLGAGL